MAHKWTDAASARSEPTIRVLPLARQPEDLDIPLYGLPFGAFYAALPDGADLVRLDRAIRRGVLTGLVAVQRPAVWLVYARGKRKGPEHLVEHCAWAALGGYVERPGPLKRFAVWLLKRHDAGTANRLQAAVRELPR